VPRVIGIDPGTVSIDLCGLDDGRVFMDRTLPTAEALADPRVLIEVMEEAGPLDLVAGPSGYGLPLVRVQDVTDTDLRLAYLGAPDESGGIGGLSSLLRALAATALPVMLTPGVVHLATVPAYRKVNRVDMGTADKVCAAALGIHEQAGRRGCTVEATSFVLLELGGAFSAALAVEGGRIVDGVGGTSGPMGVRAAGALDGEVAFLAGTVPKRMLFGGGAADVAGTPSAPVDALARPESPRAVLAWAAYLESAVKAIVAMLVSAPRAAEVLLSGRMATVAGVREELALRLQDLFDGPVLALEGFARVSKQAAQGAALIADGLAGGASAALVSALGIREASGTVLDHLHVIAPADARRRLGLA
jgi:predicted butyrate kinase (DUF1464 family)